MSAWPDVRLSPPKILKGAGDAHEPSGAPAIMLRICVLALR